MPRRMENRFRRAFFHLLALIHHQDALRDLGDHTHVVGDEDDRHVHLVLERPDELQDLGLNRHVERGRGFVGDQQRGFAGERHRDHHPLPHAAGELVRMPVEDLRGFGNAHLLQHTQCLTPRRAVILALVQPDRLGDLLADRVHGIERGHRLLEDHCDLGAADPAHRPCTGAREVDPLPGRPREVESPGQDAAAAVLDQAHQRQRGHRLPRSGFADDGNRLAAADGKRHVAHRGNDALGASELDRQRRNGKKRIARSEGHGPAR